MKITGKRIIQKVVAIFIIMMMTLSDFTIVGMNVVSYAIDMIATNSDNVEFSAYFINANKEKVTNIESNINAQDLKMYVEIAVKREGYFNGQITLENASFNLKEEILSDYVKQIDGNTVVLNKINANNTAVIELGVEYNNSEKISISSLNQDSIVNLSGTYVSSKKDKSVTGSSKVRIDWKSSDEAKSEMTTEILTNSIHKVNDVNKRIIQVLVNSKLANNSYPVKTTDIEITVPEGAEEVKVHARKTDATSSDIDFETGNYDYNSENKILKINLSNKESNGIVNWKKDALDTLVITYLYDEKVDLSGKELTVKDTINTFDNRQLDSNTKLVLGEEKNGIITVDTNNKENTIYKGKIYTGEDREYTTFTTVNIDYSNVVDQIILDEKESEFLIGKDAKKSNIQYVQSRINKSDVQRLLGEEGTIEITDQDENNVIDINKDTNTDEEGYINIKYNDNVKSIKMKMSKPVVNGTLNVEHIKKISNSKLSREDINKLNDISQKVYVEYKETNENNIKNSIENNIKLKGTISQIKVETNKETLTTSNKNEGLKTTVTLLTNGEDKNLYKNPKIKLTLPKEIEKVENIKVNLIYGEDSLKIKTTKLNEENNHKIIEVQIDGSQEKYSNAAIEGIKVLIQADVTLKQTSVNKLENINVQVDNENDEKVVNAEKNIEIINLKSIITTNDIAELGVSTIENGNTNKVNLAINDNEKNVTIQSNIINNESKSINNVRILGKIPTNNSNNNVGITLKREVKISTNNANKVKVYYTDNENASEDINNLENGWKETSNKNSVKYLIIVDKLDVGEDIKYSYEINIPKNLKYNLKAEEGYEVKYQGINETDKNVSSTQIILTTGEGAEISQHVRASINGKNLESGANVKIGEIIKYDITVENNGNADAKDIKVKATIPEGTTKVAMTKVYNDEDMMPGTAEKDKPKRKQYVTSDQKEVIFDKININKGDKTVLSFEVRVNDNIDDNKETACEVVTTYNKKDSNEVIKHILKKADFTMDLSTSYRMNDALKVGYNYDYCLKIKNYSSEDKKNVKIHFEKNESLKITGVSYRYQEEQHNLNNRDGIEEYVIETIKAGDTVEVWLSTIIQYSDNLKQTNLYVTINDNNNLYCSNSIDEPVTGVIKLNVKATTDSNSKKDNNYVTSGNTINYKLSIKNDGNADANSLVVKNEISNYVTVKNVKVNGKEVKYRTETKFNSGKSYSVLIINTTLKAGDTCIIEINTSVNKITSNEVLQITNKAYVYNDTLLSESEYTTYYVTTDKTIVSETEAEKNADGYDGSSENNNQNESSSKYAISGTVWFDEDKNGARTTSEQKLSSINVHLLNSATNKIIANTKSGEDGFYSFTDIPRGEYIVIFEYDSGLYIPTTYQAKNVDATQNSDAIQSKMKIDNEEKTVAITDNIKLNRNVSNIDLGLIKADKFDLELNKYATKMTVVNSNETKTYEFDKSTLSKVEIAAKYLKNSTVLIEYTIEVKNTGELSGYVQSIVDYKPTELEFSSNLNKDWYSSGNKLYNDSLKNTEIKAGETKEIKLILTKKMTESNTGLTNNTAEIAKAYNNKGISDIDSTPMNNKKEDDLGSADIIIGVKTGAVVSYVCLTITTLIVLAGGAYLVNKKILNKDVKA